jgi:hypothetical protein
VTVLGAVVGGCFVIVVDPKVLSVSGPGQVAGLSDSSNDDVGHGIAWADDFKRCFLFALSKVEVRRSGFGCGRFRS